MKTSIETVQKAIKTSKVYITRHASEQAQSRGIDLAEGFFNIMRMTDRVVYMKKYFDYKSGLEGMRIGYLDSNYHEVLLVFVENSIKSTAKDFPYVLKTAQYYNSEYASERKARRKGFEVVYEF